MASKIQKKYTIAAQGTLRIKDDKVMIENSDTGEVILLNDLYSDFANKECKLSIAYGEDLD